MKVAIITGASSGLGRDFAKEMYKTKRADFFYLIARREDRLIKLKEELDGNAITISADLTTDEGLQKVKDALSSNNPEVKYLINASGYGKFGLYNEISDEDTKGMIDLNVTALVRMTNIVLPYIVEGGKIIQIASCAGFSVLPAFNVYASTKAFVVHYTKALKYEVKPRKITATAVCPCWIETEFFDRAGYDATMPKSKKPMLKSEHVVKKALKSADKGKTLCVISWYSKAQHVLGKLLPYTFTTKIWLKMLNKKIK